MNSNFGQADPPQNRKTLEVCCLSVAKKLNRGDYQNWRNRDYIELSVQIKRVTKIYLSENTLKRFFGKIKTPEQYQPQRATRDAIASYIGYIDWEDFEKQESARHKNLAITINAIKDTDKSQNVDQKKQLTVTSQKIWLTLTGYAGFLLLLSLLYRWYQRNNETDQKVKFYCVNPIGLSPHSAIFKLHSNSGRSIPQHNYTIDFNNWRGGKAQWKDSTISCYYEKPGVYYPQLYLNKTIIDSTQVVLMSEGWEITAQSEQDTLRLYPILKGSKNLKNPPLVSSQDIYISGIDTMKAFFINFTYIKPDERISADNLCIEADIQASSSRPGIRCSQADLTVYGSKNSHYFSLTKPECISWSYYKFGEISKSGKNDDLSDFGHDMLKKRKLKLDIKRQKVKIYLDNNLIFITEYTKPVGHFMGINLMFGGIGKVSNIQVTSN